MSILRNDVIAVPYGKSLHKTVAKKLVHCIEKEEEEVVSWVFIERVKVYAEIQRLVRLIPIALPI